MVGPVVGHVKQFWPHFFYGIIMLFSIIFVNNDNDKIMLMRLYHLVPLDYYLY